MKVKREFSMVNVTNKYVNGNKNRQCITAYLFKCGGCAGRWGGIVNERMCLLTATYENVRN